MNMQQNATAEQQEQQRMAAEMQMQKQALQQQQYYLYKQQTVMQIVNALQQVDPFEVIKVISQYGIYTLQLDPQESMYCANCILQLFNDPSNDFTLDNWREFLRVLNCAASTTMQMQMSRIGRPGMGNYNSFGMMGMNGMGMGGFGNPGMGMGMNGMGMGGNQYGMMGGPMGMGQFQGGGDKQGENEAADIEATKAQMKTVFSNLIYQSDPIIFINYLLQDNFEPRLANNEMFPNVLRKLIENSLWRIQDNILQTIYYAVSYLYNNEYQKKLNQGNGKKAQFNGMDMSGMNNFGMGGFGNPNFAMGMNGMNMGGFGNPGMGMGMNGMGMGGNSFGNSFGNGMGMGGSPFGNGGAPMGNFGMNMGMGMMPPMNGMSGGNGMFMGNNFGNGFGQGNFGFGMNTQGLGSMNQASPMW
jgi:hypothetical protein